MSKKTRYFLLVSGAILIVGLGTGLVASYLGLPVSLSSQAAGPAELQYVPPDAAVVAYANVRDVMNSEFRRRFRELEPPSTDRDQFEQKTGLDIERDIDSVVAAFMPGTDDLSARPERSAVVLARGRFEAARLEALALEHGGTAEDYKGKRLLTRLDSGKTDADGMAVGFIEADLVGLGSAEAVKRAIDAGADHRNVASNNDLMRLVAELDNSNVWAVGRFDALARQARLPSEVQAQLPTVTWFSAAGHVNGGVNGVFKAEARDEAAAQNLRDVVRGFLAMARLQAGSRPGMQQMVDSLQLTGEGTTVALAFSIPSEFFDALEAMAKQRQGNGR
ncbi:MAG TPA: hypothetical protein PLH72_07010 [Vicinamibacterales bacterium]|nr:hypothetical protein [Vicinamibacterales bacterium]